jgi:type IV secretion system protein VirB6
MACDVIQTGRNFLSGTLTHIDCQARVIGSYGFGALSDPHSAVFHALTGLLTIFIAIWGIRLLLGHPVRSRDAVSAICRVGIMLTLATSWPAFRTIIYDVVMEAPLETSRSIAAAAALPGSDGSMIARLQRADDSIVVLTMYGSGRLTGGVVSGTDLGDTFRGIALADQFALGGGRAAFLTGTIVPFAIARIGAGILLALTPLMAAMLLFSGTAGLFKGWLRGLVFCAIASLGQFMVQSVELAIIAPWLQGTLATRQAGSYTPSAPTELLVLATAFSAIGLGVIFLIGRVAFQPSMISNMLVDLAHETIPSLSGAYGPSERAYEGAAGQSRASSLSRSLSVQMQREAQHNLAVTALPDSIAGRRQDVLTTLAGGSAPQTIEPLGASFRRTTHRSSREAQRRDSKA